MDKILKHPYWTAFGVIVGITGIVISSYLSISPSSNNNTELQTLSGNSGKSSSFDLSALVAIESINEDMLKAYAIQLMSMVNDGDVNSLKFITERPRRKEIAYDSLKEEWLSRDVEDVIFVREENFWKKNFPFFESVTNENIKKMALFMREPELRQGDGFEYYLIDTVVMIPGIRVPDNGESQFYLIDNRIYWRPFGW